MLLDLRERFAAPDSVSDERVRKVRAVGRASGRAAAVALVLGKLFKDLRFLLTGLVGDGVDGGRRQCGGGDWRGRRLADRDGVWRGGGGAQMLTRRGSEPSELPNTMLVAPRTLRTGKFFWALAAHVPCLHYNWILHSAAANELLPLRDYLLPAAD
jgi:hypothetical protein